VHSYEKNAKPYGEFAAIKDRKFTDFDEVRDMINELTDKDAGTRKGTLVLIISF
jgi:replication fork clamp-binding protein CrfC